MINYCFLLILLVIVFTNVYLNYYKTTEKFFSKNKNKKKKRSQREREEQLRELNELIKNTNNYIRTDYLNKKLKEFDLTQIKGYLEHFNKEYTKLQRDYEKENVKKEQKNNVSYQENLLFNFIGDRLNWKFL